MTTREDSYPALSSEHSHWLCFLEIVLPKEWKENSVAWAAKKPRVPSKSCKFFVCLFCFLGPCLQPMEGSSQARGWIGATVAGLRHKPKQCRIWAASVTYTIAHSNAGSPTHWDRPGIKPASSRFCCATMGTPKSCRFNGLAGGHRQVRQALYKREGNKGVILSPIILQIFFYTLDLFPSSLEIQHHCTTLRYIFWCII